MSIRSFRLSGFAVIDFVGVILLAELFLYLRGRGVSLRQRVIYYLFSFILGIVMHDFFNIKTRISI